MAQQEKVLTPTLTSHMGAGLSPSYPLSIHLPVNDLRKREEDGPSTLIPTTHMAHLDKALWCELVEDFCLSLFITPPFKQISKYIFRKSKRN